MERITQEKLNEILRSHNCWLKDKQKGDQAVLQGKDLSYRNLCGADLCGG